MFATARTMFARTAIAFAPTVALMLITAGVTPALARGQHGDGAAPSRIAPRDASQFDFFIGQWELVVKPAATTLAARIHGAPKLLGSWKAWRTLEGWGVDDELRITDASGNPAALTHALRVYDATAKKWNSTGVDAYRGVVSGSTGEFRDGKMILNGRGTDPEGKAYWSRSTFSDITPKSFTYTQERSFDEGKSWSAPAITIEAKRVAAIAPR